MKHYVIAGGAGFLGSHLVDYVLASGNKVTVVDDFSSGDETNVAHHSNNEHFVLIKHDIRHPLVISGQVDYVCNLACPASPIDYFQKPVDTLEINALGTKNMLDLSRDKKARFFHTSTSEVYGDPLVHPQPESYFGNVNPYCARSCYDEGKRYAEALIYNYRRTYDVNTGLIRIFNTYGPRMCPYDGRVVSTFIRQALENEPLTVHDKGQQTRSFCYVDDQIAGMVKMIHSGEEGPINIGNPHEFKVIELAKMVIEKTNSSSSITYAPPALSDPKQRKPDLKIAEKKLQWRPNILLEEGLTKTIAWFREQHLNGFSK